MHKDIAVKIQNVSKIYKLYNKPIDRVKESLNPFKKSYHKDFYALKNINLEIKKGEVLGIVGVNGAGKSTLLKIITGVLTPTSGKVTINGKLNAILELGSSLKPEMTGRENIKLNLQINGITKNRKILTQEIIDFADIGEHIDQPIKTYSSGMKARLGFGIETSTDPDVLIVDEVLAVGDVLFQRKCYEKIEKLFKNGKTVIFVSHSAQSVIEFCSHAVLLYDREIILEDTPKKVTDFYQKLIFSKDKKKVINTINSSILVEKEVEVTEKSSSLHQSVIIDKFSKDYYNSELKSNQQILQNSTTILEKIVIINDKNEIINILKTDEIYKLLLRFNHCSDNIANLGIAFQTKKGLSLSCTKEKLTSLISKNKLHIEWQFRCIFLKGEYFIKINLTDNNNDIIIRITDAMLFQVETIKIDKKQYKSCLIDLQQNIIKVQNDSD